MPLPLPLSLFYREDWLWSVNGTAQKVFSKNRKDGGVMALNFLRVCAFILLYNIAHMNLFSSSFCIYFHEPFQVNELFIEELPQVQYPPLGLTYETLPNCVRISYIFSSDAEE